ncbi:MAG: helix-turn-helix transcriptional regulator [Clostridia bacterium]|nr:helix-turn-helix transcriptional regulator [Clostridia bacterium]
MNNKNNLSEAIRQRIKDLAKEKNLSIRKISILSGIPYSTISSFLIKRCSSLTVATLYKICEGLGVSIIDFFNDDLFN